MKNTISAFNKKQRLLGLTFLIPAAVFILFSLIIPIAWNVVLSFSSWNGFSSMTGAGLENYKTFISDDFTIRSFGYTIVIALVSSIIALLIGLTLALLVYNTPQKEGSILRLTFFAPSMVPTIVIGILFIFLLAPNIGLINSLLRIMGLESLERAWLVDPKLVLGTISVVNGWKGSGSVMMLLYTAIIAIPPSLYEAAKMEGANYGHQVRTVTLPLIMPTIRLVSMLVLIGSFKSYDIVYSMTKGGPGSYSKVVPIQMMDVAFKYNEFGYSGAIGVIFTILVSIAIFASRFLAKGETYEY